MSITRFIKKPSIPSLTGWPEVLRPVMGPIRETIEIITGRRGQKIGQLTGTITLNQMAERINEIIRVLQDGNDTSVTVEGAVTVPPAPIPEVEEENLPPEVVQNIQIVYSGTKNALVNAQMRIAQRRKSGNYTSGGTPTMVLDQWVLRSTPTPIVTPVYAYSRTTTVPTADEAGVQLRYSLRLNLTTANNSLATNQHVRLYQPIEWFRWLQVHRRQFTVSFWMRATRTGTYTAYVILQNTEGSPLYVARKPFTVNAADTWELKTVTFGVCPSLSPTTETTYAAEFGITIAAGTDLTTGALGADQGNGWYSYTAAGTCDPNQVNGCSTGSTDIYFTAPQIESGAVRTEFEMQPFDADLRACQRYCEMSYPERYGPGQTGVNGGCTVFGADYPSADTYTMTPAIYFREEKRAAPGGASMTHYSIGGVVNNVTRLSDNSNQSMTGTWDVSETGAKLSFTLGASESDTRRAVHWIYTENGFT